ncbi:phage terminase large subunit [Campylobacter jejuni]
MDKLEINEIKSRLKALKFNHKEDKNLRRDRILKQGFKAFVFEYFPHHINFIKKESSNFRNFIYDNIDELEKKNNHLCFKAYRGSAKTTLLVRLFTLYSLLSNKKQYALIISSTLDIASESIASLKTELEENAKLINDFEIKLGDEWTSEAIVFTSFKIHKKIKAFGSGKKIRGTNYLGKRPDLIICDDIENDENVESKTQRDKLYKWFNKAILKLVARTQENYLYLVVGTILHQDSLLNRLNDDKRFLIYDFPLVLSFPDKLDLIDKNNILKSDLKGFKLDDENLNKIEILKEYFADTQSFFSEYQNKALSTENAIFSEYKIIEKEQDFDLVVLGIDPALGKAKGDYFAIAELKKVDKNKFHLKASGYKISPSKMIDVILKLYIKYLSLGKIVKIAIETIAFQEFFKDKLKEEALKLGIILSICELKNKVAKELRIDSLAPYINDGTILIDNNSNLLIEEILTYPKAAHDDLLDASEMAFRIACSAANADYKAINRILSKRKIKKGFL